MKDEENGSGSKDEEYSHQQEIRFIEFLQYHQPIGDLDVDGTMVVVDQQVPDHTKHITNQNVSNENEGKYYDKVYMR